MRCPRDCLFVNIVQTKVVGMIEIVASGSLLMSISIWVIRAGDTQEYGIDPGVPQGMPWNAFLSMLMEQKLVGKIKIAILG